MADDWPKISGRRVIPISPWMNVIERAVEFSAGATPELYHAVGQQDYIVIVAMTPDKRLPIVRQYRPALEAFTWEFPAGLVEKNEDAADTCRRELKEETGLVARAVHRLGDYSPCTARLSNRVHSFFVETEMASGAPGIERGISMRLIDMTELGALIRSGEFVLQLHLGALLLAGLHGHLDLAAVGAVPTAP
jgi:8-oxo-dGTP pyrophosphatase MutT (NUDIX family)